MHSSWHTTRHDQDIVVHRNGCEIDRFGAESIERVILVHRGSGQSPGDVLHAVVEVGASCLLLGPATGFAAQVLIEERGHWARRACVYWVHVARAPMPHRRGTRLRGPHGPAYARVPRADWAALIGRWPLQGPETQHEPRGRHRIDRWRGVSPGARTMPERPPSRGTARRGPGQ